MTKTAPGPLVGEFLRQANCDHPALPAQIDLTHLWEAAGSPPGLSPLVWNNRFAVVETSVVDGRVYTSGLNAYAYCLHLDERLSAPYLRYRRLKKHKYDFLQPLIDCPYPVVAFMAIGDLLTFNRELTAAMAADYLITGAEDLTEGDPSFEAETTVARVARAVRNEPDPLAFVDPRLRLRPRRANLGD